MRRVTIGERAFLMAEIFVLLAIAAILTGMGLGSFSVLERVGITAAFAFMSGLGLGQAMAWLTLHRWGKTSVKEEKSIESNGHFGRR